MPEWLVEHGIGEARAILVDNGEVIAARLDRPGRLRAGLIADAKLIARASRSRRGTLLFDCGEEALADGLPSEASEGSTLRVQVTRAALAEKGRYKRAQARPTNAQSRPAPTLQETLAASELPVRVVRRFREDPWPELISDAMEGDLTFTGGALQISPTPAMTLIDVDGILPAPQLARAAVPVIASAILRFDLAGSIGIDFPSLESKSDRRSVDEALAEALRDWPHQRTAINGFGFVHIVAKLERPSILSMVQQEPARTGALLLLRRAEDVREAGPIVLRAHPRVMSALSPDLRAELTNRTGRSISYETDPALALLGGFAQATSL
ncbi:ribonuclease [Novosphingobium sp. M1R2S20]|uniref:Ribonuclease n=1 Tax=Novosphingobium rhizovicinum TaxID=3228928 RepID=A0ABV3R7D5_9SPHN